MIAAILVILITILCTAQFYLKNSPLKSFATLISAIIAMVASYGYYESLAGILISRGYGAQWAHAGCFILLFTIAFAITRILSDFLVGANIDFGFPIRYASAVICGAIVGFIISGVLLTALSMTPLNPKIPYSRFEEKINISTPKSSLLNSDGFALSLFSWIGHGSFSTDQKFIDSHPEFLNQIHLSRKGSKDEILTIAAGDALTLSKKSINKTELPGGDLQYNLRIGFKGNAIKDGGAANESGTVTFLLGQLGLICKPSSGLNRTPIIVYPIKHKSTNEAWSKDNTSLDEKITLGRDEFNNSKKIALHDFMFKVPSNVALTQVQFKMSTYVSVPTATSASSEETEPVEEEQAEQPAETEEL